MQNRFKTDSYVCPAGVDPVISVRDLYESFGDKEVLKGISFDVCPGEMLGIIGPSGCGKSTILKLLCGLLNPDKGTINIATKDIALVFQGSALLNSLNVRDNIALALRSRKLARQEEDRIITEKLTLVGLHDYMYAYPTELSGGQQKRTSFARAIVNDPKAILYDEPTTGLDPVMSTVVENYMIELAKRLKPASIVVTHQFSTWTRTADRVILLHDGRIQWQGAPRQAVHSTDPFMQQFAHATTDGPILSDGTI